MQLAAGNHRGRGHHVVHAFQLFDARFQPGQQVFHPPVGIFQIRPGFFVGVEIAFPLSILIILILNLTGHTFLNGFHGFVSLPLTYGLSN
ncbi:hypothetical protein C4J81_03055 [Deltaproteobacteria bacterium Smac51]|nr:hypothetical protein C4J81_03055 [Deltaproteobacteria bacterium Smac51]